jgi:hypothetical protein
MTQPNPKVVESLATLCAFIGWAEEDDAVYGGRKADEAMKALSIVTGIPTSKIREVAGVDR